MAHSIGLAFISYTSRDAHGTRVARAVAQRLRSAGFTPWLWEESRQVGADTHDEYLGHVHAASVFVAVISAVYHSSNAVSRELTEALSVQDDLNIGAFPRRFIFPIRVNGATVPLKLGRLNFFSVDTTLGVHLKKFVEQVVRDGPQFMLESNPFSFDRWPAPILSSDGGIDAVCVIGNTVKTGTGDMIGGVADARLGDHVLAPARQPQTNRPAAMLPDLVSALERERAGLRVGGAASSADILDAPGVIGITDHVLIRHHREMITTRNLICVGAGDTNGVTKWVLDHYGQHLPVAFAGSDDSHALYFAKDTGALRKLRTVQPIPGQLIAVQGDDQSRYHALLAILPNPANRAKCVVIAAGLTALGTEAAILALSRWKQGLKESPGVAGNWLRVLVGVEDKWRAVGFRFVL